MTNNDNTFFILTTIDNTLTVRQTAKIILACNNDTEKYGLSLTEQQAILLSQTHTTALKENKRIEFNGGIVDKLILSFCDSPYISQSNFEDIIHELINIFYDLKNNTWDTLPDNDLIKFMKNAFDNICHGSLDLLYDITLRLSEHIHCGNKITTFKLREE